MSDIKLETKRKIRSYSLRIAAAIALLVGILLEILGKGTITEALIIAFGFFLINEISELRVEIRTELRSATEKITGEIRGLRESLPRGQGFPEEVDG